jgi:ABC-type branched-subunit amino acid transport system permease subunit
MTTKTIISSRRARGGADTISSVIAVMSGRPSCQYKLLAYIISGTIAGLGGSLKVFVAQNASLTD